MNSVAAPAEATAGTETSEPVTEADLSVASGTDCLIHVRFAPNGTVTEIGDRPVNASAQQWFDYLSRNTQNLYRALSGGRGLFRMTRAKVDELKTACSSELSA